MAMRFNEAPANSPGIARDQLAARGAATMAPLQ